MKRHLIITLLSSIILSACSQEDIEVYPFRGYKTHYLKYYYQDNRLVQSFKYDRDQLTLFTIYDENGDISTTRFKYSETGLVDSAYIKEKNLKRDLAFIYEDTLVKEIRILTNREFHHRMIFDRDNKGRIIRWSLISMTLGILQQVNFTWQGQNIARYETTIFDGFFNPTYIYEFNHYDQFWNPYNYVFRSIGFNFIDFIPLCENNWIEMVYYKKDNYEGTWVRYINKFSYYGRYPCVNEFIQQGNKFNNQNYVEYNYSNTLH